MINNDKVLKVARTGTTSTLAAFRNFIPETHFLGFLAF